MPSWSVHNGFQAAPRWAGKSALLSLPRFQKREIAGQGRIPESIVEDLVLSYIHRGSRLPRPLCPCKRPECQRTGTHGQNGHGTQRNTLMQGAPLHHADALGDGSVPRAIALARGRGDPHQSRARLVVLSPSRCLARKSVAVFLASVPNLPKPACSAGAPVSVNESSSTSAGSALRAW